MRSTTMVLALLGVLLVTAHSAEITLANSDHGDCSIRNVEGEVVFTCNATQHPGSCASQVAALDAKVDRLESKLDQIINILSTLSLRSDEELAPWSPSGSFWSQGLSRVSCSGSPIPAATFVDMSGVYSVTVSGFSHTRDYAYGYLCNGECGCESAPPKMTATGLAPRGCYKYALFLYSARGHSSSCSSHTVSVNGGATNSVEEDATPTANLGYATASSDGKIAFAFTRDANCGGGHVQVSGISLARVYGATGASCSAPPSPPPPPPPPSPPDETLAPWSPSGSFWSQGLSRVSCSGSPIPAATFVDMSGVYSVTVSGFSHTRDYAYGYLCNGECGCESAPPKMTATGLAPRGCYKYALFLYSARGHSSSCSSHTVSVNGGATNSVEEDATPTANLGYATASSDGKIAFAFTRDANCGGGHVQVSGISLARVYGASCS